MFNTQPDELIVKLTLKNTKQNKAVMDEWIKQLDAKQLLTNAHIFNYNAEVVKYSVFTIQHYTNITKAINKISFYCCHILRKTATEYYYSQKAKHNIKYYCFYCEKDKK